MTALQRFRTDAGLSQYEMASYLEVSRSTVNLVESSKRQLPKEAAIRFARLAGQFYGNQPSDGKTAVLNENNADRFETERKKFADDQADKMENCRLKARLLGRKLKIMKAGYDRVHKKMTLLNRISHEDLKEQDLAAPTWIAIHAQHSRKKLQQKDVVAQEIMQAEIDLLLGMADLHEKAWKQFSRP